MRRTKLHLNLTLTEFVSLVGDIKLGITVDPQKQSTLAKACEWNMFYHPIEPRRCGNKNSPVIRINLFGVVFSHDKPFEMLDDLLSCLAETLGGQLWLS